VGSPGADAPARPAGAGVLLDGAASGVRATVRAALGRRPAADLPLIEVVDFATEPAVIAAMDKGGFALAILDVRLPDGDGIELLEQIRRDHTLAALPVLMLSSEAEIKDRVRGLRMGANNSWSRGVRSLMKNAMLAPE